MNHMDEGTIHAWLDGALDDAQSREIEAHIAGCAACSAAVAEARGLSAGASRILAALDDVPGGVIPRAGVASMNVAAAPRTGAAASPPRTAARLKARGQWRVTRWASGIAAVLVAAVVLSTANKADRSAANLLTEKALVADTGGSVAAAPGAAAADEAATVGTPAPTRREVASSAPPPSTPAPAPDAGVAGGRVAGAAVTRSAVANQARKSATAVAEQRAIAPSFGEIVADRPAPPPAAEAMQQDSTRLARVDTTRVVESITVTALGATTRDVERYTGCYRIAVAPEAGVGAAKGVAAGADASRRRTASERTDRAAAPSAAAAPQMSDFSARGLPSVVRLDTARSRLGYTVRLPSDSAVGSWRIVGDSIRLEFGTRGVLMLSPLQRVSCPAGDE